MLSLKNQLSLRGRWSRGATLITILIPKTYLSREYTAGVGDELPIDLTAIIPAGTGTTTFAFFGAAPTGASLAGTDLTVNTSTITDGQSFTIRRTDDDGDRDFIFTIDLVDADLAVAGETATVTLGDDTNPDTTFDLTITGGAYDGETVTVSITMLSVPAGQGVNLLVPQAELTTDAGTVGSADASDVLDIARGGLWAPPIGEALPAITRSVVDSTDAIIGSLPYTVLGTENSTIRIAETDGTNVVYSAPVSVISSGGGGGGSLTYIDSDMTADNVDVTSQTFSSKALGTGEVIVLVANRDGGVPASVTVGGVPATFIVEQDGYSDNRVSAWIVSSTAASGDIVVDFGVDVARWVGVHWYLAPAGTVVSDFAANYETIGLTAPWSVSLDVDTVLNGAAIMAFAVFNEGAGSTALDLVVGAAEDVGSVPAPTGSFKVWSATGTSAETRAMSVGDSVEPTKRHSGIALALS